MLRVSVIVPVYNLEGYIAECITSIQNQTYQDLQIIIVDDGSTDATFHICGEIAKKDKRINLYRIDHGGAAAARNAGLAHVEGDCIFWVDADDTIHPQALEILTHMMTETNADISKIELTEKAMSFHEGIVVYKKQEYFRKVLTDEIKSYMAGTLFKKELFDGIRFPEAMMVEDYAVYPDVVNRAEIIAATNKNLYFYRRCRHGSETDIGKNQICGLWARAYLTARRYEIYKDEYQKESEIVLSQAVSYTNITYMKMTKKGGYEEERSLLYNFLKKNKGTICRNPYISHYKKKVAISIINHSAMVYAFAYLHELKSRIKSVYKGRKK